MSGCIGFSVTCISEKQKKSEKDMVSRVPESEENFAVISLAGLPTQWAPFSIAGSIERFFISKGLEHRTHYSPLLLPPLAL